MSENTSYIEINFDVVNHPKERSALTPAEALRKRSLQRNVLAATMTCAAMSAWFGLIAVATYALSIIVSTPY